MPRRIVRRRVKRHVGKGAISDLLGSFGLGRRRVRRRHRGAGFFGDLWDGVKNVGRNLAGPVAGLIAKRVGLGRRRRHRGRGPMGPPPPYKAPQLNHGPGILGQLNGLLKKHKVVSNALSNAGWHRTAKVARWFGYGKRKRGGMAMMGRGANVLAF